MKDTPKLVSIWCPSLIDLHARVNELDYANLVVQILPDTTHIKGYWLVCRMNDWQKVRWEQTFRMPRAVVLR